MILKVDTTINEKTITILKESQEALNTGIKSGIGSDFSALTDLGLFSTQLDNLKKAVERLSTYHENFIAVVEENKYQWGEVAGQVGGDLNQIGAGDSSVVSASGGASIGSGRGADGKYSGGSYGGTGGG
jgi:hypothetical protein